MLATRHRALSTHVVELHSEYHVVSQTSQTLHSAERAAAGTVSTGCVPAVNEISMWNAMTNVTWPATLVLTSFDVDVCTPDSTNTASLL